MPSGHRRPHELRSPAAGARRPTVEARRLPQAEPHTTAVPWHLETMTQDERELAGCRKVSLEVGVRHDEVTQEVERDAVAAGEYQGNPREQGGLPGKSVKRALDNTG